MARGRPEDNDAPKISVYDIGQGGVQLVKHPFQAGPTELLHAQNAEIIFDDEEAGAGAICKRSGFERFDEASLDGPILGMHGFPVPITGVDPPGPSPFFVPPVSLFDEVGTLVWNPPSTDTDPLGGLIVPVVSPPPSESMLINLVSIAPGASYREATLDTIPVIPDYQAQVSCEFWLRTNLPLDFPGTSTLNLVVSVRRITPAASTTLRTVNLRNNTVPMTPGVWYKFAPDDEGDLSNSWANLTTNNDLSTLNGAVIRIAVAYVALILHPGGLQLDMADIRLRVRPVP